MIKKIAKPLLTVAVVGWLLWYLVSHWEQLENLARFTLRDGLWLLLINIAGALVSTFVSVIMLRAFDVRAKVRDMFLLYNASVLLNYVPMKFGSIYRANYLKRHYGLKYTHFAVFFLYLSVLMMVTTSLIGLVVLLAVFGIDQDIKLALAGTYVMVMILAVLVSIIPIPTPTGDGVFRTFIQKVLDGRKLVVNNKPVLGACSALLLINYVLSAIRIGIVFKVCGVDLNFFGCLIIGSLSYISLFLSITPGSLGIRELVMSFGSVVLGIPFETAMVVAMLDRAVVLSWCFTVGVFCALWLRRNKSLANLSD